MGKLKKNYWNFILLALIIIPQLIIYLPHVGTGFVKDDFVWLDSMVFNQDVDYLKPFVETTGFFRPLVSLSFGLQYEWFGLNPRPYGFFNLVFHILNIIMVYLLFSSIEAYRPYSFLITFLFTMSIKSSTMAVGWISGRTTLMFTFFTLFSFYLYLKRKALYFNQGIKHRIILLYSFVALFFLAALMSKESAAAFPLFIVLFNYWELQNEKKKNDTFFSGLITVLKRFYRAFVSASAFIFPLLAYFFLRLKSNAYTPFNTPEYYRYTLVPWDLITNLVEYISRSIIFDIFLLVYLIFLLMIMKKKSVIRQNLNMETIRFGTFWFLCFILPMLPISIRSDIYVYMPQLGLHLVFAVLILSALKTIDFEIRSMKLRYLLFIPVLSFFIVWMGYFWLRASAYGKDGKSSTRFSGEILKQSAWINRHSRLIIVDLNKDKNFSPLNSISYGLNSLFKLYLPETEVRGELISLTQLSEMKCDDKALRFFFHNQNVLIGPLKCFEIRNLLFSFALHPVKPFKTSGKKRMFMKYNQRRGDIKNKKNQPHSD